MESRARGRRRPPPPGLDLVLPQLDRLNDPQGEPFYRETAGVAEAVRSLRQPTPMPPAESDPDWDLYPSGFKCPITLQLFRHPVLAYDGNVYEEAYLDRWVRSNRNSPMTRQTLLTKQWLPFPGMMRLIEEFQQDILPRLRELRALRTDSRIRLSGENPSTAAAEIPAREISSTSLELLVAEMRAEMRSLHAEIAALRSAPIQTVPAAATETATVPAQLEPPAPIAVVDQPAVAPLPPVPLTTGPCARSRLVQAQTAIPPSAESPPVPAAVAMPVARETPSPLFGQPAPQYRLGLFSPFEVPSGVPQRAPSPASTSSYEDETNWDELLFAAATAGDVNDIVRCLGNSADINARSADGFTPLLVAVANMREAAVNRLLSNEPAPNVDAIVTNRQYQIESRIMQSGDGQINIQYQATALMIAVRMKRHHQEAAFNIMELLVNAGADVHAIDCLGRTALHWAAIGNDYRAINFLLQHGARPDVRDSERRTPLEIGRFYNPDHFNVHAATILQQGHPTARNQPIAIPYVHGHASQHWPRRPGR